MNVSVLGANGRVGRLVVARVLDRGHRVRAFVHSRDPFPPREGLEVVTGDVRDRAAVDEVVTGADAVVSTLGTFRRRGTPPVLASGVRTVAEAMHGHGVGRLVVLTGAGVVRPDGRTNLNRVVLRLMDRAAVPDVDEAVQVLAASGLDRVVVCAPTITPDGDDAYRLSGRMPSLLAKVSGPAVAACLVDLAGGRAQQTGVVGLRQPAA